MDISELVIMLTFLLIPGIIFVFVEQKGAFSSDNSDIVIILKAILYGFFSYAILAATYSFINVFCNGDNLEVEFFNSLELLPSKDDMNTIHINIAEILITSAIAFLMANMKKSISNFIFELNSLEYDKDNLNKEKYRKNKRRKNKREKNEHRKNKYRKFLKKRYIRYSFYRIKSGIDSTEKILILKILDICKYLKIIRRTMTDNRNVWSYILTGYESYVIVNDEQDKKIYTGILVSNGNKDGIRELYIEKVFVIDIENLSIKKAQSIYLSRKSDFPWNIELLPLTENELTKEKQEEILENILFNLGIKDIIELENDDEYVNQVKEAQVKLEKNKNNSNSSKKKRLKD